MATPTPSNHNFQHQPIRVPLRAVPSQGGQLTHASSMVDSRPEASMESKVPQTQKAEKTTLEMVKEEMLRTRQETEVPFPESTNEESVKCDYDFTLVEDDFLSINIKSSPQKVKYPAKQHARSVAKHLNASKGLLYLMGQPSVLEEDSDQPQPFKQRRYFYYLSGADFENCVLTYDIEKDFLQLYIPPVNPKEVIWLGPTPSVSECEEKYDVDNVTLIGESYEYVQNYMAKNTTSKVYILHKSAGPAEQCRQLLYLINSKEYDTMYREIVDFRSLQPAMDAARVIKSEYEISMIRRANDISSQAHSLVLKNMAHIKNETQIEAVFGATCVSEGAKKQAYGIIAASGENASTLHYVANDQPLHNRQLVCLDAGCEWDCYASDITRTFPISGTFSKEAQEIYDIVEDMQEQCIKLVKPGKVFRDLHNLAMTIAIKGLMRLGVLYNGTFEEVAPAGRIFFPHGLGHHLGLEVHDVTFSQRLLMEVCGGNQNVFNDARTRHSTERKSRGSYKHHHSSFVGVPSPRYPYDGHQALEPNMVITVEPGIYFSRYAIRDTFENSPALAKYINKDVVEKYFPIGGVRIEDDILVTADGYENLTTAPKGKEACDIIKKGKADADKGCGKGRGGWSLWG